jgi:hypothetical protein
MFACVAFAQDPTGALEGEVADPSAGAVAGAAVTVRNLRTGFTASQPTTGEGLFRFPLLPPGSYLLKVESPKFAPFSQEPIQIVVSQTSRVAVALQLSGVTESVTVAADASPIDTSTNTLGSTVTGRQALDLPLNGTISPSSGCCRAVSRRLPRDC